MARYIILKVLYHTRKEAEKAYQERLNSINEMLEEKDVNDMTMDELRGDFIRYQVTHDKIRSGTLENYEYKSFENIANVKVTDFNDNTKYYKL